MKKRITKRGYKFIKWHLKRQHCNSRYSLHFVRKLMKYIAAERKLTKELKHKLILADNLFADLIVLRHLQSGKFDGK